MLRATAGNSALDLVDRVVSDMKGYPTIYALPRHGTMLWGAA